MYKPKNDLEAFRQDKLKKEDAMSSNENNSTILHLGKSISPEGETIIHKNGRMNIEKVERGNNNVREKISFVQEWIKAHLIQEFVSWTRPLLKGEESIIDEYKEHMRAIQAMSVRLLRYGIDKNVLKAYALDEWTTNEEGKQMHYLVNFEDRKSVV